MFLHYLHTPITTQGTALATSTHEYTKVMLQLPKNAHVHPSLCDMYKINLSQEYQWTMIHLTLLIIYSASPHIEAHTYYNFSSRKITKAVPVGSLGWVDLLALSPDFYGQQNAINMLMSRSPLSFLFHVSFYISVQSKKTEKVAIIFVCWGCNKLLKHTAIQQKIYVMPSLNKNWQMFTF